MSTRDLSRAEETLRALAEIIGGGGRVDRASVAEVLRALARSQEQERLQRETIVRLENAHRTIDGLREALQKADDDTIGAKYKRRSAFGDGVVQLRCGARLLIRGGVPVKIHDGDPETDRDARRRLAIEEASTLWSMPLIVVGEWEDGEAELTDDDIPF